MRYDAPVRGLNVFFVHQIVFFAVRLASYAWFTSETGLIIMGAWDY
jgi:hypothetical protein